MADYTTFVAGFPEFQDTNRELVTQKLNEAILQLDAPTFGTFFDSAVYLFTAQKLAKSPFGNAAKLVSKDGSTVYDAELELLRAAVVSGYRVT